MPYHPEFKPDVNQFYDWAERHLDDGSEHSVAFHRFMVDKAISDLNHIIRHEASKRTEEELMATMPQNTNQR